jgi:NADP+-dependent farnesol dehydrogenase
MFPKYNLTDVFVLFYLQSISPGLVKTEILDVSGIAFPSENVYRNYAHLEAKDVAEAVLYVLGTPPHVQV